MAILLHAIQRNPVSLASIHEAAGRDRDYRFAGSAADVGSLRAADVAIVNIDHLTPCDVTRLQLLGAPPDVALISTSQSIEQLDRVRAKSVAVLSEPLSTFAVAVALGKAKTAVLLRRIESLGELLSAYGHVDPPSRGEAPRQHIPDRESIECVESAANYVKFHTTAGTSTVRITMTQVEEHFRGTSVVRTHRKWFVNLERVSELATDCAGRIRLRARGGKEIPVGRLYRQSILDRVRSQGWRDRDHVRSATEERFAALATT